MGEDVAVVSAVEEGDGVRKVGEAVGSGVGVAVTGGVGGKLQPVNIKASTSSGNATRCSTLEPIRDV